MRDPVITISRQRGSGADEIAALVAQQLNIPLYDQQVLSRAAAESGVSESAMADAERSQGFLSRMLESLGRYAGMGVEGSVPIDFSSVSMLYTSADFRAVIEQILRNIADSGPGVIVGHGGAQVALRHLNREEAKKDVEQTDRERTEFFKNNYNINWYDLRLYDLVINSGPRQYQDVAEEICTVARMMPDRTLAETPDHPPLRA